MTERQSTRLETEGLDKIPTGVQSHPPSARICTKCRLFKSLDYFGKPKISRPHSWCLNCRSLKAKEHYQKNTHYYKNRDKTKIRNSRAIMARRKFVLDILSLSKCKDCGERNPFVLQFDHVRGEKCFSISGGISKKSLENLKQEISKCDIRCANCHILKTAKERNWYKNWNLSEDLKSYLS